MRIASALCAPILGLTLALPLAARADEAVATAAGAGAPPTVTQDTAAQIDAFIRSAPPPKLDDGTPDGVVPPERKVHGSVGVAVGSGGYRSGYVTSVMPVGKTGTLALAVGSIRPGRSRAIAVAAGLVIASWMLDGLGQAVDWLDVWRPLSPYYQAIGTNPLRNGAQWGAWALLSALTALLVGLAAAGLGRRDVEQ